MNRLSIGVISWHSNRMLKSMDRPISIMMLAMAISLGAYGWLVVPLERAVGEIREDTETLRGKIADRNSPKGSGGPSVQLEEFYRRFPPPGSVPESLQKIFYAAGRANVALDRAEYRMVGNTNGGLSRYDLTLPLKGRYSQIRQFLAQVIKEQPNLSLEGVSFSRHGAADIGVEVQLRLTLYLRERE